MSNVIKASMVRYSEVIKPFDTNERADNYQKEFVDNYIAKNIAQKQANLDNVSGGFADGVDTVPDDDGFKPGLFAERVEEASSESTEEELEKNANLISDMEARLEELRNEAASIIENANREAAEIVAAAEAQAEELSEAARTEGYENGREEGLSAAADEVEAAKEQLNNERAELKREYERKTDELTPAFTELLLKYVNKLTGIYAEDKREIILHLIESGIKGRKSGNDYIIRVSTADYPLVTQSQEALAQIMPEGASFEVIEDPLLDSNACMIETETRIFDCSLGEQLSGLTEDLKLLAQRD